MRYLIGLCLLVLAACASPPAFDTMTPPLVLTGEITRADHQTYREIPFTPPPGTGRISIDFAYTGKDQKTVIDIGLRDPDGQRGWSGGNKSHIEISEFEATPSYRPGRVQAGEWKLVLGVPNIRVGQTSTYLATITFAAAGETQKIETFADLSKPISAEAGWRRGDFHNHTAHSDGSCPFYAGQPRNNSDPLRAPCPAVHTFDAARDAGLDFVAITDHNTITQLDDIRRLQGGYPKTLLIPGTEVTTFFGHANVIGNSDFVDFQLDSPRLPTLVKLFDEAAAQGAIVSVNHPGLPSGEICMGCGWTAKDTDWSRVTAMEVINGSTLRTGGADAGTGGIAFWEKLLRQGYRITAIGGSDNHDATDRAGAKQSPVGRPATIVYAKELSTRGIVEGVKSGRAFVDAAGLSGAVLDMQARAGTRLAWMGGAMQLNAGEEAGITVTTVNVSGETRMEIVADGLDTEAGPMALGQAPSFKVKLASDATHGWLRVNIRSVDGKLLLLGNPIYFTRATAP